MSDIIAFVPVALAGVLLGYVLRPLLDRRAVPGYGACEVCGVPFEFDGEHFCRAGLLREQAQDRDRARLSALREAVDGCGYEIGADGPPCGYMAGGDPVPDLCYDCQRKVFTAIAALVDVGQKR